MATTIKWIDNNKIETAHRIYKSSTYFTKDNLPAPLVELGHDVTEYVDSAGVDGENWYIVSALLNGYEVFSEPFIAGLSTAHIHDIFGDNSAVATYNFDGDATDLGGNYNGTWDGTESYVNAVIGKAASFNTTSAVVLPSALINIIESKNEISFSFLINHQQNNTGRHLRSFGIATTNINLIFGMMSTGIMYTKFNGIDKSYGSFVTGEWLHITIVVDGSSNTLNLYVNAAESLSNGTEAPGVAAEENVIGRGYNTASGFGMDGLIDQFRIFNRALTQSEVDQIYQEGANFL